MKRAGAGVPSANRITLLRDADGDGVAETRSVVPRGPEFAVRHGAGRRRPLRRQHRRGRALSLHGRRHRRSPAPGVKVADLPGGPLNHHWTKNIIASRDGTQALRRPSAPTATSPRTAWTRRTTAPRSSRSIAATGADARVRLRPAQSERPGLGAADRRAVDGGQRARRARQRPRARLPDLGEGRRRSTAGPTATTASTSTRASQPQRPDLVAKAIVPDYALGAHTASLGLAFYDGKLLPQRYRGRRLHRPARLVEPQAAQRLQGDVRAVRRRQARRARRRTC